MPQDGLPDPRPGAAEAFLTQPPRPRRRWPRVLAGVGAAVVLVPVLAAGAVVAFFDPAGQVPRIEQAIQRATGREAHLRAVRVGWSLTPTLSLDGLTLANAPGGSDPVMLDVPHAEARIALLPLASRRIEVASVSLADPRLLLETDAAGRGNWVFARPVGEVGTPAAPGRRAEGFVPDLRRVEVTGGSVRLRDGQTGRVLDVALPRLHLDAASTGTALSADTVAGGLALAVQAKAGPLSALLHPAPSDPSPWPLALEVQGSGIRASATGTFPDPSRWQADSFALDAQVADLQPLLPAVPLHDVSLAGQWTPSGLADLTAKAGQSDLSSVLPGLALRSASLTAPAVGQPARVQVDALLDGAPLALAATVLPRPEGQGAALRGLDATGRFGDLAGDVALSWSPRPAVRGTLVSRRFDLDWVRGLRSRLLARAETAGPGGAPSAPDATPDQAAGGDRVIPDTGVPFQLLRAADADLRWSGGSVRLGGSDWQGVELRAVLGDGRLRLDPFAASSPGGRLDATLLADAGQPQPSLQLRLRLPGVAVAPLAALLGRPDAASGTAQGEAELRASGPTLRALAASLDGTAALTLVDGELDTAAAFPALVGLLRSAGIPATLRGRSVVRCLALSAVAQHGAVQLRTAYLDSSRLRLSAEGGLNLADETLALRLRPALRLGPTDAAVPLRLEGSLARPQPHLDQIAPGRVGAVIGVQRAPGDECGPALLAARGGREGPMPAAPEQPTGGNPADVLRRLLR